VLRTRYAYAFRLRKWLAAALLLAALFFGRWSRRTRAGLRERLPSNHRHLTSIQFADVTTSLTVATPFWLISLFTTAVSLRDSRWTGTRVPSRTINGETGTTLLRALITPAAPGWTRSEGRLVAISSPAAFDTLYSDALLLTGFACLKPRHHPFLHTYPSQA